MLLIPAIDLRGGRCVRLEQGDFARDTVYSDDPLAVARSFAEAGAQWLHVVDLDGAATGQPYHLDLIARIARETALRVEMGGGVRSLEILRAVLTAGVGRAVLGTSALRDPQFVAAAVRQYGVDAIVVGIDARNGRVATQGWLETSDVLATDLARRMAEVGVGRIIATDIARDGMRTGPDLDGLRALQAAAPVALIASGGVGSVVHLRALDALNVEGVIVGRALYTGDITLSDAAAWWPSAPRGAA